MASVSHMDQYQGWFRLNLKVWTKNKTDQIFCLQRWSPSWQLEDESVSVSLLHASENECDWVCKTIIFTKLYQYWGHFLQQQEVVPVKKKKQQQKLNTAFPAQNSVSG